VSEEGPGGAREVCWRDCAARECHEPIVAITAATDYMMRTRLSDRNGSVASGRPAALRERPESSHITGRFGGCSAPSAAVADRSATPVQRVARTIKTWQLLSNDPSRIANITPLPTTLSCCAKLAGCSRDPDVHAWRSERPRQHRTNLETLRRPRIVS